MTTITEKPTILLVDDEKSILDALYRFCRQRKWHALRANSGAEGLDILDTETVDVIVSDMRMPNMDGAAFLAKARQKAPGSVRILLTGYADMEAVISAVNEAKIYNYLNKPWDENMLASVINSALDFKHKEDERLRLIQEVAEKNDALQQLNDVLEDKVKARTEELQLALQTVQASNQKITQRFKESLSLMTRVIEMQDGSKANYTNMVADASVAIAKALDLSAKEIEQIRIAALLHNIGKLSLPEAIRQKPMNNLSPMEMDIFKTHSIQGEAVLSSMTGLRMVAKLVRSHQEYINGKGYPDKLKDQQIPIGSKIICVTSDFQKLESNLLLKEIAEPEDAIQHIRTMSGKHYDARVVALFEQYYATHLQNYRSRLSQLPLKDVKEGMVLAENLISASGLLLLTQETHITQEHLNQLATYEEDIGSQLIFPILNRSIDALKATDKSTTDKSTTDKETDDHSQGKS